MAPQLSNQRIAWFNGVHARRPHHDPVPTAAGAAIAPRYGRTFEGALFRRKRYRLFLPLAAPFASIPACRPRRGSEEVVARTEHCGPPLGDWWVAPARQPRQVDAVGDERWDHTGRTVIEVPPLLPPRALTARRRGDTDVLRRTAPHAEPARQDATIST
jgi:hypothetical protein